ncbi:putative mitogen-activated protein kinase kinase kinase 7-like [Taenia solium]|eukprot:TsM_000044000 transcript=TsM_000044000 gene=TsM_000044000
MVRDKDNLKKVKDKELAIYAERVKSVPNVLEDDIKIEKWGASGGGYGVVSFGIYRRKNVVRKDFRFMNTIIERLYNYREAYTLASCNHPNIVKFIGAGPNTRMADVRYVVIERATDVSLGEIIYSKVEYNIWHVMLWALHLADGLDYLHSRTEPIIHRDLKPANMLLFDGCTTLKISDFGSSKIFEVNKADLQSVNQGSLLYMAPEVKQHTKNEFYTCYSKAVDIYSMTISLWEMLTRRLDHDVNPHSVKIRSCPPFLKGLFGRGMAVDPCQRPSASQLVRLFDFIMRNVCTKTTLQLCINLKNANVLSASSGTRTCTEAASKFGGEIKPAPEKRESALDFGFENEIAIMIPHIEVTDCLTEILDPREKALKRREKGTSRRVKLSFAARPPSDSKDS